MQPARQQPRNSVRPAQSRILHQSADDIDQVLLFDRLDEVGITTSLDRGINVGLQNG